MRKIIFILLLSAIVACNSQNVDYSNDQSKISKSQVIKTLNEADISILKSKYTDLIIYQNINISDYTELVNSILNDSLINEGIELDFENALVFKSEEKNFISYTLKDKVSDKYYTYIGNNKKTKTVINKPKSFILEINSDSEGTGFMQYKDREQMRLAKFHRDSLISETIESNKPLTKGFRDCFDDVYDTICDDFIGCLAWYTNPPLPVLALIYCL